MDDQMKTIEKLMKDLFKIREEYGEKSDKYIQKVKLLVAKFNVTRDDRHSNEAHLLHNKHKTLTQTYHKKVINLHEKISHAMAV